MLSAQFLPPSLVGYDWPSAMPSDDSHPRQPSQPELHAAMPPHDQPYEDRRDAEERQRNEDRVTRLLETIKATTLQGMGEISGQISGVRNEMREMVAKGNAAALENVRTLTELRMRAEAADRATAALALEFAEFRAEVKPLQQAFWKYAGMGSLAGGGIAILLEALDLFGRHAK